MPWTAQSKTIQLASPATAHAAPAGRPHAVTGASPGGTAPTITPAELYGATARCSHLHQVNASAVTPESRIVQTLVEHYVDDPPAGFFILRTTRTFKDFILSYFSGAVASGVAYLYMVKHGYTWFDHFENQKPAGNAAAAASPDFVFAKAGSSDLVLVESKGTLSTTKAALNRTTGKGYSRQIEPHLGYAVGSRVATCGMALGSWMVPPASATPTTSECAHLYVHHTGLVVQQAPSAGGGDDDPASGDAGGDGGTSIVAGNYAAAFDLVFGPGAGDPLRKGRFPDGLNFRQVFWLGDSWLIPTAEPVPPDTLQNGWSGPLDGGVEREAPRFVMHSRTAHALREVLEKGDKAALDSFIPPLPDFLFGQAYADRSALFPDGLAVIARDVELPETPPVRAVLSGATNPQPGEGVLSYLARQQAELQRSLQEQVQPPFPGLEQY